MATQMMSSNDFGDPHFLSSATIVSKFQYLVYLQQPPYIPFDLCGTLRLALISNCWHTSTLS